MRAVLFDFDGTLADTAPDLGAALNKMLTDRGKAVLAVDAVRAYASSGARGLLRKGFGVVPEDAGYESMRVEFIANYRAAICVHTRLFPGMRWGIVTNKAIGLTIPIVAQLGLTKRAACVVGGDTTPHLKPHPASLLHASGEIGIPPAECFYLGDDLRDILAAKAAGMHPVAVEYGYSGTDNGGPRGWDARTVIAQPLDLLAHL